MGHGYPKFNHQIDNDVLLLVRIMLLANSFIKSPVWWCASLIPAPGRLDVWDFWEFEAILVYRASSRTTRATQRYPDLKNQKRKKRQLERGLGIKCKKYLEPSGNLCLVL